MSADMESAFQMLDHSLSLIGSSLMESIGDVSDRVSISVFHLVKNTVGSAVFGSVYFRLVSNSR